jgi:hypothetical protein
MDGGIQPTRPSELEPNELFGDGGNGTLFIGTKGKMMCDTYSENPRLLPLSRNENINVAQKYDRVIDGANGHYKQWVEGCIAGYGKKELSSPFEMQTETLHANLIADIINTAEMYASWLGQGLLKITVE